MVFQLEQRLLQFWVSSTPIQLSLFFLKLKLVKVLFNTDVNNTSYHNGINLAENSRHSVAATSILTITDLIFRVLHKVVHDSQPSNKLIFSNGVPVYQIDHDSIEKNNPIQGELAVSYTHNFGVCTKAVFENIDSIPVIDFNFAGFVLMGEILR